MTLAGLVPKTRSFRGGGTRLDSARVVIDSEKDRRMYSDDLNKVNLHRDSRLADNEISWSTTALCKMHAPGLCHGDSRRARARATRVSKQDESGLRAAIPISCGNESAGIAFLGFARGFAVSNLAHTAGPRRRRGARSLLDHR